MSEFVMLLKVTATSYDDAMKVRDEAVQALEDARDSGELPEGAVFDMGAVNETDSDHQKSLIDAARDIHAIPSGDEIEVDSDARISEGCDGTWVQGWLFVDKAELKKRGIASSEIPEDEEEGDTDE